MVWNNEFGRFKEFGKHRTLEEGENFCCKNQFYIKFIRSIV